MNNPERKNIERRIKNIIELHYPNFIVNNNFEFVFEENNVLTEISFYCQTIAGQDVLHSFVNIFHKDIESSWSRYSNELLIQSNIQYPTISLNAVSLGIADSLTRTTIVIGQMNSDELNDFTNKLFGQIYKENIAFYKSIKNCDEVINKSIEIDEETKKISHITGLPFRKVILAKKVGNPNLPTIKEVMRIYCEQQYEIGKKENFEKLMRLKPVYKKLFG